MEEKKLITKLFFLNVNDILKYSTLAEKKIAISNIFHIQLIFKIKFSPRF